MDDTMLLSFGDPELVPTDLMDERVLAYEFGGFVLDPAQYVLIRNGEPYSSRLKTYTHGESNMELF
jgi:hypothetical protein